MGSRGERRGFSRTPRGLGRALSPAAKDCFGPPSPGGGEQPPQVCVLSRRLELSVAGLVLPPTGTVWPSPSPSEAVTGDGDSLTAWVKKPRRGHGGPGR